jgi:transposase
MGKVKPKYQPIFTKEQIKECGKIVQSRKESYTKVLRAKMVLELHNKPDISHPELSKRVGLAEVTVRKWRKIWATEEFRLEDAQRSGRPVTYGQKEIVQVKAVACEIPLKKTFL